MNKDRLEIRLTIPAIIFMLFYCWAENIAGRNPMEFPGLSGQAAKCNNKEGASSNDKPSDLSLGDLAKLTGLMVAVGYVISTVFSLTGRQLLGMELLSEPIPQQKVTPKLPSDAPTHELPSNPVTAECDKKLTRIEKLIWPGEKGEITDPLVLTPEKSRVSRDCDCRFWSWTREKSFVSIYRVCSLPKEHRDWIERRANIIWLSGNTFTGLVIVVFYAFYKMYLVPATSLGLFGSWFLLWGVVLLLSCVSMLVTNHELKSFTRYCVGMGIVEKSKEKDPTLGEKDQKSYS